LTNFSLPIVNLLLICHSVLGVARECSLRKGVPYCEVPCYKSLFGPKLYGFGSQVESHDYSPKSERKVSSEKRISDFAHLQVAKQNELNISMNSPRMNGRAPKVTKTQLEELEKRLHLHNEAHPNNFINLIEKDGSVTLEGSLRLHWGVQTNITFKKDDSMETTPFATRIRRINKTKSFHRHNDLFSLDFVDENASKQAKDPFNTLKSSGIPPEVSSQQLLAVKMKRGQFHTIKESKVKRRCSINGHYYKNETSDNFTPAFGSVTTIFVGSHLPTNEVIRRLLDKFKIENSPTQFALYMVKPNGEMWPLTETDYPVMERVNLMDPTARIFLMDKPHQVSIQNESGETDVHANNTLLNHAIDSVWQPVQDVPSLKVPAELAGFMCLPEPMLNGFITMFDGQQAAAEEKIRNKYGELKKSIMRLMTEKQLTQETYL